MDTRVGWASGLQEMLWDLIAPEGYAPVTWTWDAVTLHLDRSLCMPEAKQRKRVEYFIQPFSSYVKSNFRVLTIKKIYFQELLFLSFFFFLAIPSFCNALSIHSHMLVLPFRKVQFTSLKSFLRFHWWSSLPFRESVSCFYRRLHGPDLHRDHESKLYAYLQGWTRNSNTTIVEMKEKRSYKKAFKMLKYQF